MASLNRRSVMAGSAATLFGALAGKVAFGQTDPNTLRRGAVVIGVDKPTGISELSAAASGARKMEKFFQFQGFERVIPLIDDDAGGEVLALDIHDAVASLVNADSLDQLVIYFSGHGFRLGQAEHWLLSRAPRNASETVSMAECAEAAVFTGIPNVVLISDACRSHPRTFANARIGSEGYLVFPQGGVFTGKVKVDLFHATGPGQVAYEINPDASSQNFQGVFTEALLHAFVAPWDDMVVTLDNGIQVIPNWKLEYYLIAETQRRIQEADILLEQIPDIRVTSYAVQSAIGTRVELSGGPGFTPPAPPEKLETADLSTGVALSNLLARSALEFDAGNVTAFVSSLSAPAATEPERAAQAQVLAALERQAGDPDLPMTGLTVEGADVAQIIVTDGSEVSDVTPPEAARQMFQIGLSGSEATTGLIVFENGGSMPLAILEQFVANVSIDPDTGYAVDVRYNPTTDSPRHFEFQDNRLNIETMRATTSAAAAAGAFLFGGVDKDAAAQFADRIRILKRFDPTLGLYCSYAYAEAFRYAELSSVAEIMQYDFEAALFDIAMLDRKFRDQIAAGSDIPQKWPGYEGRLTVPFCPAFKAGWERLRGNQIALPPDLQKARAYLTESLWTTFSPEGTNLVIERVLKGAFP